LNSKNLTPISADEAMLARIVTIDSAGLDSTQNQEIRKSGNQEIRKSGNQETTD